MIIKFISYIAVVLFCFETKAQVYPKYSIQPIEEKISQIKNIINSSLVDSIGNDSMLLLLTEFKEYSDCLYYTMLWNISVTETNKEKRILMLRKASNYPYYIVTNSYLQENARLIYKGSIWELIRAYEGDAEGLKSIPINEGYRTYFYPTLKIKIEAAGGVWDRGPLSNKIILRNNDPFKQN